MRCLRVPVALHWIALDKIEDAIQHVDDRGEYYHYPDHPPLPQIQWPRNTEDECADGGLARGIGYDIDATEDEIHFKCIHDGVFGQEL